MSLTTFAGQWMLDANGWWWKNNDGSYPVNSWKWIDGNLDGIAERYYFNEQGYCLMNTSTPDGKQVNSEGAEIRNNGVVNTTAVAPLQSAVILGTRFTPPADVWYIWGYEALVPYEKDVFRPTDDDPNKIVVKNDESTYFYVGPWDVDLFEYKYSEPSPYIRKKFISTDGYRMGDIVTVSTLESKGFKDFGGDYYGNEYRKIMIAENGELYSEYITINGKGKVTAMSWKWRN